MIKNYYEILEVDEKATQQEIKKAYKLLARKHHPDKGGDEAKFKEVNEAYQHLSDINKRNEYDMHRANPNGFNPFTNNPFGNSDPFFGTNFNFDEMFRQFTQPQRNGDLNLNVNISFRDSYFGKDIIAKYNTRKGTPSEIKINIPEGISHGEQILVPNMGDDSFPQFGRGNLIVRVLVKEDENFLRNGNNLCKIIDINPIESIIGTTRAIAHINGELINFTIPKGVANGAEFSKKGKGFKNSKTGHTGSLNCIINIKPLKIDNKEIIEELKSINQRIMNNV